MVTPAALDPSPANWYQRVACDGSDPETVPTIGRAADGLEPGSSAARTLAGASSTTATANARRSVARSIFMCSSVSADAAQPARLNLHAARIIGFFRTIFYPRSVRTERQQIMTHAADPSSIMA